MESQFAQLGILSYLYPLRVPSETLTIRRAFFDDPLTEFAPQTDKAPMGIRTHSGREVLVVKFPSGEIFTADASFFGPASDGKSMTAPGPSVRYTRSVR